MHVVGAWLASKPEGAALFEGISPNGASSALKMMLEAIEVPDAGGYRPHDLRRGHAEDLRASGL